jgi:hypothetical protein
MVVEVGGGMVEVVHRDERESVRMVSTGALVATTKGMVCMYVCVMCGIRD